MSTTEVKEAWTEKLEYSEALDAVMSTLWAFQQLELNFDELFRIHAIVDTNVIYSDLRYMFRNKGNERRRPAIFELLAKRTIIGFFPQEKLKEVDEKCIEMAERYGVDPTELAELWVRYKKVLHIVPTGTIALDRLDVQTLAARDPTDLAFAQARHAVGASVILSSDPDIVASGAPVMPGTLQVFLDLRHYSRQQGVMAAAKLGTGTVVIAPIAVMIVAIRTLMNSIPREALYAAAGVLALALLLPQSRKVIVDTGKAAWEKVCAVGNQVLPVLGEACMAAEKARKQAQAIRSQIDEGLRRAFKQQGLALRQAVFRACAVSERPLYAQEVWALAARYGAKSAAKDPLASVRRALRAHPLLQAMPDGRWRCISTLA